MKTHYLLLIAGALYCMSIPVPAITNITVNVTVQAPLCDLNGGAPVQVDFGNNVITTQVDSGIYKQPVNFTLSCMNNTQNDMRLRFTGTGASFDAASFATTVNGLGIRMLSGAGTPLDRDAWLNYTYPNLPIIQAELIKDSSVTLPGGVFSGNATLEVEFI